MEEHRFRERPPYGPFQPLSEARGILRRAREPTRRQPVLCKRRKPGSRSDACVGRIVVARILHRPDARRTERRPEPITLDSQAWSEQPQPPVLDDRAHRGEASSSAATAGPHQKRLDLILEMVRDEEMEDAHPNTPVEQEPIARLARGLLNTRRGRRCLPAEHVVTDPEWSELAPDRGRFRSRFRPQPVIDGERVQPATAPAHPVREKKRERHAVRAAGHCDGDTRRRLVRAQTIHQIGKFSPSERVPRRAIRIAAGVQTQASACFSCSARRRIWSAESGYSRRSLFIATQASFSLFSAARDRPSFSRLSGALLPFEARL